MKYPVGIQTFEDIRRGNYVYVDKTSYVYQLATMGKFFFLSRPRRFGKSLLLSTLEAYFEGKKELFQGLAIEKLESDWETYPVLRFDLGGVDYTGENGLNNKLRYCLKCLEEDYGIDPSDDEHSIRFDRLIRAVYNKTGKQVVVLIDEYDKPLLDAINHPELQERNRVLLKAFYSVLKAQDKYIRFGFLTGVSKFSKVTIFSGLNNLMDISLDEEFAGVCGITETELYDTFKSSIEELAAKQEMSYEETCQRLKQRYDGYHFARKCEGVYNPFSLLNTFSRKEFRDGWFKSATPTYLVEVLKRNDFFLPNLQDAVVTEDLLGDVNTIERTPLPLFYQSGYLTIKSYDKEFEEYTLDFPNEEVRRGFWGHLLPSYFHSHEPDDTFAIGHFVKEVQRGEADKFMKRLQMMFNDTSYRLTGDAEKYIQNVIYLLFRLMGFYVKAEYEICDGRIDMLVETPQYVYVMELKVNKTAKEALAQINEKDYTKIYSADGRKVFKIGINFKTRNRTISEYIIEQL